MGYFTGWKKLKKTERASHWLPGLGRKGCVRKKKKKEGLASNLSKGEKADPLSNGEKKKKEN